MTLEKLRQSKKLTFQAIADDLGKHKERIYRIIMTPWRTSIDSFLLVSRHIGMPDPEAIQEWEKAKVKFKLKQIKKKIAATK